MASIQKRKNKNGTSHWRAVVRIKGFPTVCNHFYASGGNREAYLAFLPFALFPEGFYGYVKKSEFIKAVTNKTKAPWQT